MTSYAGNHYEPPPNEIEVFFQRSDDGVVWRPVDSERVVSYEGGVSEVAFETDADGDFWFITRNEDGDATGLCAYGVDSHCRRCVRMPLSSSYG